MGHSIFRERKSQGKLSYCKEWLTFSVIVARTVLLGFSSEIYFMKRFRLNRPDNTFPTEKGIWHAVMGDEQPIITSGLMGQDRVKFPSDFPVKTEIWCPHIGFTNIVSSCAHCNLGQCRECPVLEKFNDSIAQNVYLVLYDYSVRFKKGIKMPAKKPTLIIEVNSGDDMKEGKLFDLEQLNKAGVNVLDTSKAYFPVLKKYTAQVALVPKGKAKSSQKEGPVGLLFSGKSKKIGLLSDLLKLDAIENGDEVYELGEPMEFQIQLVQARNPKKKTEAVVPSPENTPKKKAPRAKKKAGVVVDTPKPRGRPKKNVSVF